MILQTLWGNDSFFNARSLDVFITKLRKLLIKDPAVQIINVRGVGYKLVY
jgi:DNA-binding response OmpR family regulator